MIELVKKFGRALDKDDFTTAAETLADDCIYDIGSEKLIGPAAICGSYEQNMIEGRKKLDKLEWGECKVEQLSEKEFYIHFTDYLGHAGKEFTFRCKQKVTVGNELIIRIEHLEEPEERERLNTWYREVGLM